MNTFDPSTLIDHVTEQRWYGAKSRAVAEAEVRESVVVRTAEPQLALALVQLRYETGAHDLYQLLYLLSEGELGLDALGENPGLARELVSAMRAGADAPGRRRDRRVPRGGGLRGARARARARRGALRRQRAVEHVDRLRRGADPEGLPPARAGASTRSSSCCGSSSERGFANHPALGGWYEYSGGQLAATLGILQEYVAGAVDGWDLALDEIADAPERFLDRLRRLGEVTGRDAHACSARIHPTRRSRRRSRASSRSGC